MAPGQTTPDSMCREDIKLDVLQIIDGINITLCWAHRLFLKTELFCIVFRESPDSGF